MRYPSPGEYQEAVQFPATAFSDPLLQDAEPEMSTLGLPRAITGAFAVVFPVETRGARWALKCFLTDVSDQRRRYRAIADHLHDADLPYTAKFEYQPDGIRVAGRSFPLLKMEWLDGTSLNRFLAQNRSREVLETLIRRWRTLVADLEDAGIAHGDLQHGNILVDAGGLEDNFAPRLRLVDYDTMYVPSLAGKKSPEVGHRNYQHPDRDEHAFGPSLDRFSALVIDTALQACLHRPELWEEFDTGENVLFRSDDFADPAASSVFDEVRRIEALRPQVEALERACFIELQRVPALHEVIANAEAVPAASGKRRRQSSAERGAARRDAFEAAFLPISAAAAVVILASAAMGWWAAAVMCLLAVIFACAVVVLRYRRLPVVRRRRRLLRENAYFRQLIDGLRSELAAMKRRRDQFQQSWASRAAERLEDVQEAALHDRLKHHFVGEARGFEGLTHKVIVRLKAAGVRTASHATPTRIAELTRISPESKARVNLWRSTLAARYQDDIPTSLSPAEERRLRRGMERELSGFDRDIARLKEKIAIQEREHAKIRERLDALVVPTIRRYVAFLLRIREGLR